MFKIATWNVNSLRVRMPHVLEWLETHQPDVLALQETKVQDHDFPLEDIESAGYRATFVGQKTFNGVAIFSKQAADDVVNAVPDYEDPQKRFLAATIAGVRVINLYVPNGSAVDSEKYRYKLDWLEHVTQCVAAELERHEKVVVLGDFNVAPEDQDVHDPQAWVGSVLVSPKEREALKGLMSLGLKDAFRLFDQESSIFSWWDYRGGQFWKNKGLRIDLILTSETMSQQCQACEVDNRPRKLTKPSDHAPVIATFA